MTAQISEIVRNNAKFLREHWRDLLKYKGKFVAIYNGEVIGVSDNYFELLEQLKSKGYDLRYVDIEYIPNENYVLIA